MSSVVLDASALLALLNQEPGAETVTGALLLGAAMSAVNLSEVVARVSETGRPREEIQEQLDPLGIEIVDFDEELAYRAGLLRQVTRAAGLSFGDRACLALGAHLGLPVLTTDRAWAGVSLGVVVQLIR